MSSENLKIYNAVREVPEEAKKPITGGRLSGKTDINPMWRIKALTEQFGPCGTGWKYTIERQWLESGVNDEVAAFCNIFLYYKTEDGWSEPLPGTGGSKFVVKENNGLYTDDDCFKKALTDAISVAAKALGIGADVYWDKDSTKYDAQSDDKQPQDNKQPKKAPPKSQGKVTSSPAPDGQTPEDVAKLKAVIMKSPELAETAKKLVAEWGYGSSKEIPHSRIDEFIAALEGA